VCIPTLTTEQRQKRSHSKANLVKLKSYDCSLPVGSETVQPASVVRDLGVLLDAQLTMKQHINKATAACFYQLRDCDRFVDVLALVTSRLDYCNSVLAALPQSTIDPLQRVQNTAARLIFNLGKREHVSPCLIQLHWLPIRYRITYKLCTLMHNVHIGKSPRYLADIVQPTSSRGTRSGLRVLSL